MRIDFKPKRWFLAGVVVLAVLVGLPARWTGRSGQAFAQEAEGRSDGARECVNCHTHPTSNRTPSLSFVTLSSFGIWKFADKHAQAYAVLKSERGQRMAQILGQDVTKRETGCLNCHAMNNVGGKPTKGLKVEDGVNCGACHGSPEKWLVDHTRKRWRKLTAEEKSKLGMYNIRNPVRRAEVCASCHVGNAAEGKVVTHAMFAAGHPPLPPFELALYSRDEPKHWRDPGEVPYFKVLDALTKLTAEPRDAKDSVKSLLKKYWKTEVEEEWVNEFVELYPTRAEALKVLKQYPYYRKASTFQTRLALVGSVVSLRSTLQLAVDRADPQSKANNAATLWPELLWGKSGDVDDATIRSEVKTHWGEIAMAHSDCYACHHELRKPSYRQLRGYGFTIPGANANNQARRIVTIPGRPLVRGWPFALFEPQVQLGSMGNRVQLTSSLEKKMRQLAQVLEARPFGKPAQVNAAASALINWCNQVLRTLNTRDINHPEVRNLLKDLCLMDGLKYADYESARLLASVFVVAYMEVESSPSCMSPRIKENLARLDQLLYLRPYREREKRLRFMRNIIKSETDLVVDDFDEFVQAIGNLDDMKVVQKLGKNQFLRSVPRKIRPQNLNQVLQSTVNQRETIADQELFDYLRTVANYDPCEFVKTMRSLATALH